MKLKEFEFNLFGVNTFVVWNTDTLEAAVIDPGMASAREEEELTEFININRLQVIHLINTHLHIDHTLGDIYVEKRYGTGLEANPADDFLGKARAEQARMFHLQGKEPEPLEINVPLKDGDRIYLGNEFLEVLEVPGHSPGSIVLYSPADKFLISGDVLFRGSIGRTDLPGGDHWTLVNTIRQKLLSLPEDTVVYPGHGPSTTIGEERDMNSYLT